MYFNKLPDVINVFLLFYKEIQSKSFLSAFLGNLNTILTKIKAPPRSIKPQSGKTNFLSPI